MNRQRFIMSPMGIVDLVTIIPTFVAVRGDATPLSTFFPALDLSNLQHLQSSSL